MTDPKRLVDAIDAKAALEFLAEMIRFKSYSGEPGESDLARFMVARMKAIGLGAEQQRVVGAKTRESRRLARS